MIDKIKIFDSEQEGFELIKEQDVRQIFVDGHYYFIGRFQNKFYVGNDRCPHRGAPLSNGKINFLGEIVCPLHAYRFQLKDGCNNENSCPDVKMYTTICDDDGVFFILT